VKKSETAKDVIDSLRGMELSMGNCPTDSTELAGRIRKMEPSGPAENATASATPARSSPLSADEEQRLYRIRKDRANRFMVAVTDVDFLLEVIERLNQANGLGLSQSKRNSSCNEPSAQA
jgi:hypothetical protein